MSILVIYDVRPRHAREWANHLCVDYGRLSLGYEAKLRYRVFPDSGKQDPRQSQPWLHHTARVHHVWLDSKRSICGETTGGADEWFMVDQLGNAGPDTHFASWPTFGNMCMGKGSGYPCIQIGYVVGRLRVSHLVRHGHRDRPFSVPESHYVCRWGAGYERAYKEPADRAIGPGSPPPKLVAVEGCPSDGSASPVDPVDEQALLLIYGDANYSYGYQIDHCRRALLVTAGSASGRPIWTFTGRRARGGEGDIACASPDGELFRDLFGGELEDEDLGHYGAGGWQQPGPEGRGGPIGQKMILGGGFSGPFAASNPGRPSSILESPRGLFGLIDPPPLSPGAVTPGWSPFRRDD
jgi:hypothetical protein